MLRRAQAGRVAPLCASEKRSIAVVFTVDQSRHIHRVCEQLRRALHHCQFAWRQWAWLRSVLGAFALFAAFDRARKGHMGVGGWLTCGERGSTSAAFLSLPRGGF